MNGRNALLRTGLCIASAILLSSCDAAKPGAENAEQPSHGMTLLDRLLQRSAVDASDLPYSDPATEPGPFMETTGFEELLVIESAETVTTDRQVVLSLDGSGSIDPADWDLQKQGIIASLNDEVSFPRDGTIAIAVSQWSNGITRQELPLTAIDTQATVDSLVSLIDGLVQIGGSTNPGDGVRSATDTLLAQGDSSAEWLICQSTDGVLNSGEALNTAVDFARISGVDRYSLVAIEDGSFDRNAAQAFYGPEVYGGGAVNVARNTAEFASLLIGTCLNPPLEVVALELNQAVQSWDMSIALVQDKPAVLRAFIQSVDGSEVVTTGLLHGVTATGGDLPKSPLAAANPGGAVTVRGDVAGRRSDRNATLNFNVPGNWIQQGVKFRLELPGGALCSEVAAPSGSCEIDVNTVATQALDLRVLGISYQDGSNNVVTPSKVQLREQGLRVQTQFPVARVNIDIGGFSEVLTESPDSLLDLVGRVSDMRSDECFLGTCNENQYWYGLLEGFGGGIAQGIPSQVSIGFSDSGSTLEFQGYARNRVAHEVAHSGGRPHAVDGGLGLVNRDGVDLKQGYCGELAGANAMDFHDFNEIGGSTVPTLGPIGDPQTELWGFDQRFVSGNEALSVSDPKMTLPLMSYGNGRNCRITQVGQRRWISGFTYLQLLDTLSASSSSETVSTGSDTSVIEVMFISGVINHTADTVVFRNSRVLPSVKAIPASSGSLTLDVLDLNGVVIDSVSFDAQLTGADDPVSGDITSYFNVPVAKPAVPIGSVEVKSGNIVLGTLDASSAAPVVSIVLPAAGTEINTEVVDVSWDGTDADGDVITYSVYYTPDGSNWRGLVNNTSDSEIKVSKSQLTASNNGSLMVVASDGLNSTRSVLDLIVIGNNKPDVDVVSPTNAQAFSGVQSVFLSANAEDREDGPLDGQSVQWVSDLDGALGAGASLQFLASDLTEGQHTITVTATDSEGAMTAALVTVNISRLPVIASNCPVTEVPLTGDRLQGNAGSEEITRSVIVGLPAGRYHVTLHYEDMFHPAQPDQPYESWFVEGLDVAGDVILRTMPSDDLPSADVSGSTAVGVYDMTGVTEIRGRHALITSHFNSIEPVMVSFVPDNPGCTAE